MRLKVVGYNSNYDCHLCSGIPREHMPQFVDLTTDAKLPFTNEELVGKEVEAECVFPFIVIAQGVCVVGEGEPPEPRPLEPVECESWEKEKP